MKVNPDSNMEQIILETAEKLFLEKGFALTSTTEIARVAGCNQALVHYYFRTKENLFSSIFEKKFKAFFQHIFDFNFQENVSFSDKLKRMVETHFDLLYDNPRLPSLILNELSRRPEHLQQLKEKLHEFPEQLFSIMNNELQEEIRAGRVREISLMDIVTTVVSLNVALFTMFPVASGLLGFSDEENKQILQHRREEHVKIILSYIRP